MPDKEHTIKILGNIDDFKAKLEEIQKLVNNFNATIKINADIPAAETISPLRHRITKRPPTKNTDLDNFPQVGVPGPTKYPTTGTGTTPTGPVRPIPPVPPRPDTSPLITPQQVSRLPAIMPMLMSVIGPLIGRYQQYTPVNMQGNTAATLKALNQTIARMETLTRLGQRTPGGVPWARRPQAYQEIGYSNAYAGALQKALAEFQATPDVSLGPTGRLLAMQGKGAKYGLGLTMAHAAYQEATGKRLDPGKIISGLDDPTRRTQRTIGNISLDLQRMTKRVEAAKGMPGGQLRAQMEENLAELERHLAEYEQKGPILISRMTRGLNMPNLPGIQNFSIHTTQKQLDAAREFISSTLPDDDKLKTTQLNTLVNMQNALMHYHTVTEIGHGEAARARAALLQGPAPLGTNTPEKIQAIIASAGGAGRGLRSVLGGMGGGWWGGGPGKILGMLGPLGAFGSGAALLAGAFSEGIPYAQNTTALAQQLRINPQGVYQGMMTMPGIYGTSTDTTQAAQAMASASGLRAGKKTAVFLLQDTQAAIQFARAVGISVQQGGQLVGNAMVSGVFGPGGAGAFTKNLMAQAARSGMNVGTFAQGYNQLVSAFSGQTVPGNAAATLASASWLGNNFGINPLKGTNAAGTLVGLNQGLVSGQVFNSLPGPLAAQLMTNMLGHTPTSYMDVFRATERGLSNMNPNNLTPLVGVLKTARNWYQQGNTAALDVLLRNVGGVAGTFGTQLRNNFLSLPDGQWQSAIKNIATGNPSNADVQKMQQMVKNFNGSPAAGANVLLADIDSVLKQIFDILNTILGPLARGINAVTRTAAAGGGPISSPGNASLLQSTMAGAPMPTTWGVSPSSPSPGGLGKPVANSSWFSKAWSSVKGFFGNSGPSFNSMASFLNSPMIQKAAGDAASRLGIPKDWVLSQWAVETGNGKTVGGKYNYAGLGPGMSFANMESFVNEYVGTVKALHPSGGSLQQYMQSLSDAGYVSKKDSNWKDYGTIVSNRDAQVIDTPWATVTVQPKSSAQIAKKLAPSVAKETGRMTKAVGAH